MSHNHQMPVTDRYPAYKSLFDHHPEAILSFDLEGRLLESNHSAQRRLGYEASELAELSLDRLAAPDYRERSKQAFEDSANGSQYECEMVVLHKRGLRLVMTLTSFPIIINDAITGVYTVLRERESSDGATLDEQLSKAQLKFFFANVDDACLVLDTELHIIKINKAFESIFGWSEEEVLGMRLPTIVDLQQQEVERIRSLVLASRQAYCYEAFRTRKDGSLVEIAVSAAPLLGSNGEPVAIALIMKDIAERKKMIEDLRESEKRLREVMNAMPDLVSYKDGEGRWVEANQHTLIMFKLESIPYKGLTNKELAEQSGHYEEILAKSHDYDEQVWEVGHAIRQQNGLPDTPYGDRIYDIMKVPIFHADGRRNGLLTIGRDITELKQTEELLRTTDKLAVVGQLAAGIAHEIRNPLTTIKGFISLLNKQTTDKNGWYLDVMRSEIEQMEWITNQFMSVAKPQSMSYKMHRIELVLAQVASLLYPLALMNNVQIHLETEPDIPEVECDENQLIQVFINVMKNAIEAMSTGGQIKINIRRREEKHVSIRVTDHGCGIPSERIARLGEPFYSMKEKGTGLGLMICYKIVKEHGGQISIESELGQGTTVDVALPFTRTAR
ncbi:PAS domain-containing sensor histidine kinase [Paenibacillus sp. OV219]|uniref:PAS domain-containing sensor histidine kinase n=1 Tax=Paenibacillus sp. OV219 TaxID=1884377 RepID=UPI0008D762D3|nr:PAS domain-containing sensor histidine kinase [Paenibacillus sp. OV219]SEO31337.1 PAS/PAC sensor signal transduction histidine kinase [Paenibacillus sp. OV219]